MTRTHLLAALVLAVGLAPRPGLAQGVNYNPGFPATRWEVKVEVPDNRTVTGTINIGSLDVECDLGDYTIRIDKVKSIQFQQESEADKEKSEGQSQSQSQPRPQFNQGFVPFRGVVIASSGEKIEGTIRFPLLGLETELGILRLDPSKMKSITFVGKAEKEAEGENAR